LCFALRIAGRATSSGFARDRGWPGGALGLRILSKTGLAGCFLLFRGELFLTIAQPPLTSLLDSDDAIAATEDVSMSWYPCRRRRGAQTRMPLMR